MPTGLMQCLYGSYLGLKCTMCGSVCVQAAASGESRGFPGQSTSEHRARENPTLKDRVPGETMPSVVKCQMHMKCYPCITTDRV